VDCEHCITFFFIVQGLPIINVTLLVMKIMEFTSLYEIDIENKVKTSKVFCILKICYFNFIKFLAYQDMFLSNMEGF